jgi:hypothetical protein
MNNDDTMIATLTESLDELLEGAKYCAEYFKSGPPWESRRTGGCLGYPGAILLFTIIDSIGSYFYKNQDFKVKVDGKFTKINHSGWEHFKILNSKYFNLDIPEADLRILYHQYRSPLSHNAVLGDGVFMYPSSQGTKFDKLAFSRLNDGFAPNIPIVFVKELYLLCKSSVELFKQDMSEVVPNSHQVKVIGLKNKN